MKVTITGNRDYIGPGIVKEFRKIHPTAILIGYGLGNVRQFPEQLHERVVVVGSLAAISNDPIGNCFEEPSLNIIKDLLARQELDGQLKLGYDFS